MIAPLFELHAVDWTPPDPQRVDALMLTSANAATHAGDALALYAGLPCYCVGAATASAAERAGLQRIMTGPSDGLALLQLMRAEGVRNVLHLCGREHIALEHSEMRFERRIVYAADAVPALPPGAVAALRSGALALIHSPRAGRTFAELADAAGISRATVSAAAISPAAAAALGPGWRAVHAAPRPDDHALLELAAKLCQ